MLVYGVIVEVITCAITSYVEDKDLLMSGETSTY